MGATSIEWTDRSINPIRARLEGAVGHHCEKISPGCKNCYSSRLQPRFRMPTFNEQAGGKIVGLRSFLDEAKLAEVLRRRAPTKWFWCDMTDIFGEWVPDEWIAACWATMLLTPHHTHQVLTKRIERARTLLSSGRFYDLVLAAASGPRRDRPELNGIGISSPALVPAKWIWLGVSVEDQRRADERIPWLLETPAAVRFVSAEPLLGAVDLATYLDPAAAPCGETDATLDWVIVGAESGHGARPIDVDWARAIRDQCVAAGVPFFLKQFADARGHKIPLPELDGRRHVEWPSCR